MVSFSGFYSFVLVPAKIVLGIPVTTFLRADILKEASIENKGRFRIACSQLLERIGLRHSSRIVPNSQTLKEAVQGRYPIRCTRVLPNHIEQDLTLEQGERRRIRAEYGLLPDHFVITTASPLNRVKNIELLIKAFTSVAASRARLLIIGEDLARTGERTRLEDLARDLGLARQTVFTGWLEDPTGLIASSDLFVFPSLEEGSPNALLEGLASNLPVLGSRIPEIREILAFEALLFSPQDPEELSRRLQTILSDEGEYRRIRSLSKQRKQAYMFDWDHESTQLLVKSVHPCDR